MITETIKLYKLIILYFLSRAKQDIPNAILSDFILENGYTNYFSIQETLAALTEDEMVCAKQTHTACYYSITDKGKETLGYFYSQLPRDTMRQIDSYLKEHKIQISEETSVRTDYSKISNNEYLVHCAIMERRSIIAEVSLNLTSEEAALDACRRFRKKSSLIYSFLFKELTTE